MSTFTCDDVKCMIIVAIAHVYIVIKQLAKVVVDAANHDNLLTAC